MKDNLTGGKGSGLTRAWTHVEGHAAGLMHQNHTRQADLFINKIPCGALLLVSDQPMIPEGVKTELSDRTVTTQFVERHIRIGIEALKLVRRRGRSVKHLRFEDDNGAD